MTSVWLRKDIANQSYSFLLLNPDTVKKKKNRNRDPGIDIKFLSVPIIIGLNMASC